MPPAHSRLVSGLTAFAVVSALTVIGTPAAEAEPLDAIPKTTLTSGRYIVTLKAAPVATYAGNLNGLAATAPSKGRKVNAASSAARRYRSYLVERQNAVAARVGAKPLRSYAVALNGFTADLTPAQAETLQKTAGVLSVTKDRIVKRTADTNSTDFLKLSGPKGVWNKLGGKSKAGRGVVVGVIDTGIWPEAKSFAGPALGTAKPTRSNPYRPYLDGTKIVANKSDGSTFTSTCDAGEEFTAADCSTKIVGAHYFVDGFKAGTPDVDSYDYLSPRDGDSHGTHTGSTAVGNADVKATVAGHGYGRISGVAPAAKIAAYKVFWNGKTPAQDGGANSDITAAIDQAVADGVDVINFSGGSTTESALVDPSELAFLNAAAAGIFVSVSAGNSGPGASTTDHPSPWLTTVAASSIGPRTGTVTLGNGGKYVGVTTTVFAKVGPAPLVLGAAVKEAAASADDARICTPDTLSPTLTAGKIVLCDRGVVDRVAKSAEVKRAGGVGMVLTNVTDNSLNGDLHSVPTVHLNPPAADTIRTYAGTAGATATLTKGDQSPDKISYPQIAGFSSRGPSLETRSDLLKPDLAAPGVDILAAFAPALGQTEKFGFESGTSMSAPHIAGLAALYLGRYPTQSPMAIKSAMMTTARLTVDPNGKAVQDAYAQGAGNVRPWLMFNPGVVFDSGLTDWVAFMAGEGYDFGLGIKPIDPSDFNVASIAIGKLVGRQTVTRKVTAVKAGTYTTSATVGGFKATVSPKKLKFTRAGQTKTIKVAFTRTSAPLDQAVFGSVRLVGAGTTARLPVALTAAAYDAPEEVPISATSGSKGYQVTSGSTGTFTTAVSGLTAGTTQRGSVNAADGLLDQFPLAVPAGTKVLRFDLRSDEAGADIDLDLYRRVTGGGVELVQQSGSATGNEQVTVIDPSAGDYIAVVKPFAEAPSTTETLYGLTSFVVPTAAAGNLTAIPASRPVTTGQTFDITLAWSGLTATSPYLGYVAYPVGGTVVSLTP